MNDLLLSVKELNYSVDAENAKSRREIIKNINFDISNNEIIGIAGESGSGKTTLAKIVTGLLTPTSGIILLSENKSIKKNNSVQILFQNSSELLNPYRKVKSVLFEANKLSSEKFSDSDFHELLKSIGITSEIMDNKCYQLSGGQRQKIALARLILVKPKILILDEPFSSQDQFSQKKFVKVLTEININFKIALIVISHDLKILKNFVQRIFIMFEGQIVEKNLTDAIFKNPQNPYTKFLLRAEDLNLTYDDFLRFKA